MNIYEYTTASVNSFSTVDHGFISSIPSSTVDNEMLLVNNSLIEENYGEVVFTDTVYPFGTIKINSGSNSAQSTVFVATPQPIRIESSAITLKNSISAWVGTGTLFEIGGGIERIAAPWTSSSGTLKIVGYSINKVSNDYNLNTVIYYTSEDYGLVPSVVDFFVENGNILNQTSSEDNYGNIIYNTEQLSAIGNVEIKGASEDRYVPSIAGIGSIYVTGDATSAFVEPVPQIYDYEKTVAFDVIGFANVIFNRIPSYSGSGTFSAFNSSFTSETYDYNSSSIADYSTYNYGSVAASGITVNYGTIINNPSSGEEDYGYVILNDVEYPLVGNFEFSGESINIRKQSFSGSGTINVSGFETTVFVEPVPQIYEYEKTVIFNIFGTADVQAISRVYTGSGLISSIINSEEEVTYSYNQSAVVEYNKFDYGTVTVSGSTINYGLVSDKETTSEENYRYITLSETSYSLSGSFILSGQTQNTRTSNYVGTGIVSVNGAGTTSFVEPVPQIVEYENIGLFEISGSANIKILSSRNYAGTGSFITLSNSTFSETYSYNQSSVVEYSTTNYGFVTASGTTNNYGLITEQNISEFDNYGNVILTDISYPFFTSFVFANSGLENRTKVYTGTGTIFNIIGSAESAVSSFSGTGLFNITGSSSQFFSSTYTSSGSLSSIGFITELRTYDYNTSTVIEYSQNDYGNITASGSTQDYGLVSIPTNSGEEDYGYIILSETTYSSNGTLKFSGFSIDEYKPSFNYRGRGSIFAIGGSADVVSYSPDGTGLFNIYGEGGTPFSRPYIASGFLYSIGSSDETKTYDYNRSSVIEFNSEDYGLITVSGSTENYGLVTDVLDSGEQNYGYVVFTETTYALEGGFEFTGISINEFKPSFAYIGKGSIFAIGGSADVVSYGPDGTGLFDVYGEGGTPFSRPYIASGSLFSIGSGDESRTYDYNESAIVEFNFANYGLITVSGSTENYGLVSDSVDSGEENYGYIVLGVTSYPLEVSLTITGDSITSYKPSFAFEGNGTIFAIGGLADVVSYGPDGTGLFDISGTANALFPKPYIASGSLFSIGSGIESRTYDYNESAIIEFNSIDYGLITVSGSTENYGLVSDPVDSGEENYGYITFTEFTYSVSGPFKISGESINEFKPSFAYIGKGSIFAIGGSADVVSYGPDGTGLFDVYGSAETPFSRPYIASGSLFSIGSGDESRTYDYNETAVVDFNSVDYQTITLSGVTINYGLISDSLTAGKEEYGYITNYGLKPFGGFILSNSAVQVFNSISTFAGTGQFFAASGAAESTFAPVQIETQLFVLSGTSEFIFQRAFNSTGSLFTIGYINESRTYDYNDDTIVEYTSEDYGYITASGVTSDYGLIDEELSFGEKNYGYIVLSETTYSAINTISISGTSIEEYKPSFAYRGRGTIFAIGGEADVISYSPDGVGLFDISGAANVLFSRPYIASGSLFAINSANEFRTYDYNQSSVVEFSNVDYGLVTTSGATINYGLITDFAAAGEIEYGYITNIDYAHPYGDINVYGESDTPRLRKYYASGSLFGYSGAAESFSAQTPENISLHIISGSADTDRSRKYDSSGSVFVYDTGVEKQTDSYVGSGEIYFYIRGEIEVQANYVSEGGTLFNYSGAVESFSAQTPENTVLYSFSGSVTEKHTENYVGAGSVFGFFGASEAFANKAPENTQLFVISGTASGNEKHTESYVGSGSINIYTFTDKEWLYYRPVPRYVTVSGDVYISGESQFRAISNEIGSGQLTTAGTLESIKFTYDVVGSGTLFTSSGAVEVSSVSPTLETLLFNVSGSHTVSFVEGPYNGSGSISTIGGSAESFVVQTPENIILYNVSGGAVEKNTEAYLGAGTLNNISGAAESFSAQTPEDTVLFTFSGSGTESFIAQTPEDTVLFTFSGFSTERNTEAYVGTGIKNVYGYIAEKYTGDYSGSGTLFTNSGAAEVVSFNTPEQKITYNVSGSAAESYTNIYEGFGTLYKFNSAGESAAFNPVERTVTYIFSGAGSERTTDRYIGSGNISTINGSSESAVVNPPERTSLYQIYGSSTFSFSKANYIASGTIFTFIGAAESTTINPDETTVTYVLSGAGSERTTNRYIGSGSVFAFNGSAESKVFDYQAVTKLYEIYGSSVFSFAKGNYNASGTVFAFNGAAESTTINPTEDTTLYTVSGAAQYRTTSDYVGSGNISVDVSAASRIVYGRYSGSGRLNVNGNSVNRVFYSPDNQIVYAEISGSADERHIETYVGTGFISKFNGSSEIIAYNPPENTVLYTFSGSAQSSYSPTTYEATGEIHIDGDSNNSKISKYIGFEYVSTSGTFELTKTSAYEGTGNITLSSQATVIFNVSILISAVTYNISGSANDAFTKLSPTETIQIQISGESQNVLNTFTPARIFGTII